MRNAADGQKGAALLIALLVVVIMTVTVTEFLHSVWIEHFFAADFRDNVRANWAVRSGVEAAKAVIVDDAKNNMMVDHLGENWAQLSIPIPIGDTYMFASIRDESSKLNLNLLATGYKCADETTVTANNWCPVLKRLLKNLGMDEDIAGYIEDWIDDGGEDYGAEDGYYRSLEFPYPCKNAKMDSIEELRRIRGVTPKVYNELIKYLTVQSSGKININTAPVEIIKALHEDITDSMAEMVILERRKKAFTNTGDIKLVPGFDDNLFVNINNYIGVNSNTYSAEITATFNEVSRRALAIFTDRSPNGARLVYYRVI